METIINIILGIINLLALLYNLLIKLINKRKAILTINAFWKDYGTCFLVIENKGESIAKKICISEPNNISGLLNKNDNTTIETIKPGECKLIHLNNYNSIPNETVLNIKWKDKYNIQNNKLIFVNFNLQQRFFKKPEWIK